MIIKAIELLDMCEPPMARVTLWERHHSSVTLVPLADTKGLSVGQEVRVRIEPAALKEES